MYASEVFYYIILLLVLALIFGGAADATYQYFMDAGDDQEIRQRGFYNKIATMIALTILFVVSTPFTEATHEPKISPHEPVELPLTVEVMLDDELKDRFSPFTLAYGGTLFSIATALIGHCGRRSAFIWRTLKCQKNAWLY